MRPIVSRRNDVRLNDCVELTRHQKNHQVPTSGVSRRKIDYYNQNEVKTRLPREIKTNINDAKEGSVGLKPNDRRPTGSFKKVPAPMVDDDLLEFLVRVADNPAEWNKIRRVLNMLGRDEKGTTPTAAAVTAVATVGAVATPDDRTATVTTVKMAAGPVQTPKPETARPVPVTAAVAAVGGDIARGPQHPTAVPVPEWPSGDWILKAVEDIRAATRARGIVAGGDDGGAKDPFDYEDDEDDDEDDEIEEIDAPPTTPVPAIPATPPPPPPPSRISTGHMSRYQFRRIDGSPGDGRVNGTYVAVVESDSPPRGVHYDSVRQKKQKPAK